jgi:hypothetical protein
LALLKAFLLDAMIDSALLVVDPPWTSFIYMFYMYSLCFIFRNLGPMLSTFTDVNVT